jgi:hypothetical protein
MRETIEDGAPFFFATEQPPTAAAIDDDMDLTVTAAAAAPDCLGRLESIDIMLSVEYANEASAQLSTAAIAARRNEAR